MAEVLAKTEPRGLRGQIRALQDKLAFRRAPLPILSGWARAQKPPVNTLSEKKARLEKRLRDLDSVLVAYSGGVDSAYLAWIASRIPRPQDARRAGRFAFARPACIVTRRGGPFPPSRTPFRWRSSSPPRWKIPTTSATTCSAAFTAKASCSSAWKPRGARLEFRHPRLRHEPRRPRRFPAPASRPRRTTVSSPPLVDAGP